MKKSGYLYTVIDESKGMEGGETAEKVREHVVIHPTSSPVIHPTSSDLLHTSSPSLPPPFRLLE